MFSNKIYKHFFIEFTKYFLVVLFTFSAIVWTVQAVNYLDLIVEDGHAVSLYLSYSFLNISKILTKFIPLSFLIALILTIIKLQDENELIILWTSGLNKIKVINFFFKISILITVIQLFLAAFLNPYVLNYSRSLIKSSNLDFISSLIKTNQFNDTVEGLTIFVGEKTNTGVLTDIFIRDESQVLNTIEDAEDSKNLTITAKRGRIEKGLKNFLILESGMIQSEDRSDKVSTKRFKKTELVLDKIKTKTITQPKIQETSSMSLYECLKEDSFKDKIINCPHNKEKNDIRSEMNRRFGMPLYIPVVALLCSFLLVYKEESKFSFLKKYFYYFLCFVTLLVAEIVVRYSGKSIAFSLFYYLAPLISLPIIYLELLRRFYYENLRNN